MTEKCGSWPFCPAAALPDANFCARHLPIMEKVAGELRYTDAAKEKPKAKKVDRRMTQAGFEAQILDALAKQPLTAKELTAALSTRSSNRSYARARRALLDSGEIRSTAGEPKVKRFYLDGRPEPKVETRG